MIYLKENTVSMIIMYLLPAYINENCILLYKAVYATLK